MIDPIMLGSILGAPDVWKLPHKYPNMIVPYSECGYSIIDLECTWTETLVTG